HPPRSYVVIVRDARGCVSMPVLPRPAPRAPLFPYTTLFRSADFFKDDLFDIGLRPPIIVVAGHHEIAVALPAYEFVRSGADRVRSEEHTSELQSRENLVCRLLLEKKKPKSTRLNPSRVNDSY